MGLDIIGFAVFLATFVTLLLALVIGDFFFLVNKFDQAIRETLFYVMLKI